jgi:hypothetical protein
LVEEILLASRLDFDGPTLRRTVPVDLLGLAAEEAARFEASVANMAQAAEPVEIDGDLTLLRRLLRNLLENAVKHGRALVRPPSKSMTQQDSRGSRRNSLASIWHRIWGRSDGMICTDMFTVTHPSLGGFSRLCVALFDRGARQVRRVGRSSLCAAD